MPSSDAARLVDVVGSLEKIDLTAAVFSTVLITAGRPDLSLSLTVPFFQIDQQYL
jgi:hypothetical protein